MGHLAITIKIFRTFTDIDGHKNHKAWGYSYAISDNDNNIWIPNDNGLAKIKNQHIIQTYSMKNGLPSNDIRDLILDNFGNIWGIISKGIFSINNDKIIVYDQRFNDSKKNFSRIKMSENGIIWILGDSYLCSFDGEKVNYYDKRFSEYIWW